MGPNMQYQLVLNTMRRYPKFKHALQRYLAQWQYPSHHWTEVLIGHQKISDSVLRRICKL